MTFDDVVGQKEIVDTIKNMVEEGNINHLLFCGPAGVGKTSLAYVVVRSLFGKDYKANVLELNASDENGIDVIRTKIKNFAKTRGIGSDYKVIVLDESEYLSKEAQACLRRIMEQYSSNCRFILTCNYKHQIISPIQSRCIVFDFGKPSAEEIKDRLKFIIESEKLSFDESVIDSISENCSGDIRKAINILQKCIHSGDSQIDVNTLRDTDPSQIIVALSKGMFLQARSLVEGVKKYYSDERQVLTSLWEEVHSTDKLDNRQKAVYIWEIMKADERMVIGVNRQLVLDAMLIKILERYKNG